MAADLGTLLVVDDDELNRDMLSRRLERKGYSVAVSPDGPGALALVAQRAFDLVLLDVMMPGLSGLEVLKILRQRRPATELPVIMATARDQSEEIVYALRLGANDYVTKPLDFPVVMARIETQIRLKRSVEETTRLKHVLTERNQALEEANARLTRINRRMERDLRTAARIQAALLPRRVPTYATTRFAWHFEPCEELAGDSLNVVSLDDRRVGLYVLDVSGHGVASALLSVTLSRMLSAPRDPSSVLVRSAEPQDGNGSPILPLPPGEVADELSRRFPFDLTTGQYFTIIYGLFDVITGEFQYVSAGHPGLAYVPATGPPRIIDVPGFPIGLAPDPYESRSFRLEPGDRIYLYSDGITEAMSPTDVLFSAERMLGGLDRGRSAPLAESVSGLLADVRSWCRGGLRDDISLVAVEFAPAVGTGALAAGSMPGDGGGDPQAAARTAGAP
jgi:sigma-B regulation protein RsbU (phosphoserine phosphatase)